MTTCLGKSYSFCLLCMSCEVQPDPGHYSCKPFCDVNWNHCINVYSEKYSLKAGDPFKYFSSSGVKYSGVLYVSGKISMTS